MLRPVSVDPRANPRDPSRPPGDSRRRYTDPYQGRGGNQEYGDFGTELPEPGPPPRPARLRTAIIAGIATAALLGGAAVAIVLIRSPAGDVTWTAGVAASAPAGSPGGSPSRAASSSGAGAGGGAASSTISFAATGDIVLGNAPSGLPPNGGRDFFAQVKGSLGGDLQMGNLEQTITEDTGTAKCPASSAGKTCFSFRTPPGYAQVLRDAGFGLMNMANNHAYDYGQQGYTNTKAALDAAGLKYTGAPGAITIVQVNGVRIAVVGFAPYPWANDPNNLDGARKLVEEASGKADLVVVQAHLGAEGADRTHVKAGTEVYLGESRGDPVKFAHTVVDAGADLVIGHGPHVLRGMEFYQGRLVAYSLGNFGGYRALGYEGVVGVGGVLKVTLRGDGTYVDGTLVSTAMVAPGLPKADPGKQAVKLVGGLSTSDFGASGARIDSAGKVTQP
jgi:hypothetical protein